MTTSFNMSDWRRKYVLMAENDIENQAEKHTQEQDLAMASNLMDDLEQRLKTHDWFYMMSDDNRKYNNGSAQQSEIRKLVKGLEAMGYGEDAKTLYNQYAPYTPGGSDLRMKEAKVQEAKGIYFVKVSLRDALKAQEIVSDMYRNAGIMVKGEEFLASDPETIQDLIMDFGTRGIEIEDDNLDFSDYDGHSSNDMLDLYERFLNKK